MNKKTITSASDDKAFKLKVLAREKENVRRKLAVTAEKLRLKAKQLAVTAEKKENVRNKLVVTAEKKENVRNKLAVTAEKKENVRNKLVVTAQGKEDVRRRLAVTAKQLAVTAKEKESIRRKLAVTAEEKERVRNKLAVTAEEKERVRNKLAVTAQEKESIRRRLAVTAKQLAVTAKEKESIRRNLAVTARQLAVTAQEKEDVRRKLEVTAEKLAVTARERESIRRKLAVTARQLAVTAKEKEDVRRKLAVTARQLAVTAKEKEDVRRKLVVTAKQLAVTAKEKETMLASIGDGLIASDEKGNITLINKTAEKLLDNKSEAIIGKVFSEAILIEDEKGASILPQKRPMSMALTAGTTTSTTTEGATYYYVRKDKTKFPVAITVTPVILDGKVIGTIEVFRDITREKEVDRAKSEFVSLASHQLRTPPTSMKWFLEMLLSGEVGQLNEKQKEYFEDVYRNNQRMITLVNTLLNVSRIDLGVFAIEPEPTDVIALTKGIIEELDPQIHERGLRVKEKYSKNLQVVSLDPKLIRIAIQNIISNAVKYTPSKGTIGVEIFLKQSGESVGGRTMPRDCLTVVVSDNGYGIPKDQQDKIFTKLFRADNVKEKDTDGTGLGLYLAKSIIDHAHGNIWFESELNKGTIFYLTIPLKGMQKREGTTKLTMGSFGS